MSVSIDGPPDSDFGDPIGLLSDCHRRIERFLGGLHRVARDRQGGELDERYRKALETALHYFEEAAPRHTADEEESLFPRVRARLGDAERERIAALEHDHREADAAHAEVDRLGRRWLEAGRLESAEARRMLERIETLSALYTRHISAEDQEIFPLAREVLPDDEVAAVGREMAQRRGLFGQLPWLP